jgi:hypothetical protein
MNVRPPFSSPSTRNASSAMSLPSSHLIPPAIALVLVLPVNLWLHHEIARQREVCDELVNHLQRSMATQAAASGTVHCEKSTTPPGRPRAEPEAKPLLAMSREDMMSALEGLLSRTPLHEEDRARRAQLLGRLVDQDPETALITYARAIRQGDPAMRAHLARALRLWAQKNPNAASAWLDQQMQNGLFETASLDGLDPALVEMEAALVGSLLVVDPSAARTRMTVIPEEQRRLILESIPFSGLTSSAQDRYVELLRAYVPPAESVGPLMQIIAQLPSQVGYQTVDSFLDRIQATEEERRVSALQAVRTQLGRVAESRPVTTQDVDTMRSWLEQQSPDQVESITGRTLGEVAQDHARLRFDDVSALVLQYQKESGQDDVLIAFLRSFAARSNLAQAASLIPMVQDPTLRQAFMDRLK